MAQRRTPRTTPGGTRRPGQRGTTPRARVAAATPGTALGAGRGTGPGSGPGASPRRRPRFTGRAGVLLLVLAVLTVSYASSLRAYLDQRALIGDLQESIARREVSIAELEREKGRWDDPAFVRAQARERFGYVMPGQTGFQVLDADGKPLDGRDGLDDPDDVLTTTPTPWWSDAWDSVELAGNPPPAQPRAPKSINGVKKSNQESKQ
ncbi:FtsB family cell division protein [Nocardioides houyundeii]|uniref:FtsB family cell division protein n=1 Tax=Nocardioides houyundeii TaxID=2045452 RepID=UPI000DF13689|nr:septum formation initiator family protein [Nocardioides houyundeii]